MKSPKPVLIMTRPMGQARDFMDALREICDDVTVEYAPLVEIAFLPVTLPPPENRIFAFTSANGVDAYLRAHRVSGNHAFCVNDATATRARAAGFFVSQGSGDGVAMAEMITDGPVCYVHGEQISFDLCANLERRGIACDAYASYRQIPVDFLSGVRNIIHSEQCVIPVFSTNGAKLLRAQLQQIKPRNLILPCISDQVAALLSDMPNCNVQIAKSPNRAGMLSLVSGAYTAGK